MLRSLWFFLLFLSIGLQAQFSYVMDQSIPVKDEQGNELSMPWAGGLNAAHYNTMDLNGDNVDDLVLFDRMADKVLLPRELLVQAGIEHRTGCRHRRFAGRWRLPGARRTGARALRGGGSADAIEATRRPPGTAADGSRLSRAARPHAGRRLEAAAAAGAHRQAVPALPRCPLQRVRMTVHVIGGGLAGLSAAIAVAGRGERVILSEAARHAGGRCRSYHDGLLDMTIDNGNHLVLSGNVAVDR